MMRNVKKTNKPFMLKAQGINNMTRGPEEDTWHMVGKLLQLHASSSPLFH